MMREDRGRVRKYAIIGAAAAVIVVGVGGPDTCPAAERSSGHRTR
jgi:hypothetical protein